MSGITVRGARAGDEGEIHRLIVELARYEHEPDAVRATPETLAVSLFAPGASVHAHLAEDAEGQAVGLALWFLNFSTWTGRPGLYLEDLVVDERARGRGVGAALFEALAHEAEARGCARIDWAVLDWNEPAMAFYRAIGARRSEGWQPWRLEGEALTALSRRRARSR